MTRLDDEHSTRRGPSAHAAERSPGGPVCWQQLDERAADVDPATAGLEHALDQLLHLGGGEHQVCQLVTTVAGDENPARVVDPDLLDRRIVEEGLQRSEPGDPGDQLADDRLGVRDRDDGAGEAALVVVADHALGDAPHHRGVALRVDPFAAHQLADMLVELVDQLSVGVGERHPSPHVRVRLVSEPTSEQPIPHPSCAEPVDKAHRARLGLACRRLASWVRDKPSSDINTPLIPTGSRSCAPHVHSL